MFRERILYIHFPYLGSKHGISPAWCIRFVFTQKCIHLTPAFPFHCMFSKIYLIFVRKFPFSTGSPHWHYQACSVKSYVSVFIFICIWMFYDSQPVQVPMQVIRNVEFYGKQSSLSVFHKQRNVSLPQVVHKLSDLRNSFESLPHRCRRFPYISKISTDTTLFAFMRSPPCIYWIMLSTKENWWNHHISNLAIPCCYTVPIIIAEQIIQLKCTQSLESQHFSCSIQSLFQSMKSKCSTSAAWFLQIYTNSFTF